MDLIYHAGQQGSDASDIEVDSYNMGIIFPPASICYLIVQFPVTFLDQPSFNLPEITRRWSSMLKPLHGYTGFCLGRTHGYEHDIASGYE